MFIGRERGDDEEAQHIPASTSDPVHLIATTCILQQKSSVNKTQQRQKYAHDGDDDAEEVEMDELNNCAATAAKHQQQQISANNHLEVSRKCESVVILVTVLAILFLQKQIECLGFACSPCS